MSLIKNEIDILNQGIRATIIEEIIDGPENINRRLISLRKHEIYRDKNKKWVMHALRNEGFKDTTLFQMENRASNISIARKITDKLARTYTGGVSRTVGDEVSQSGIDAFTDELDANSILKKSDRYRQLHRNTLIGTLPINNIREDKIELKSRVFAPWQYDVVENPNDLTKPMVVILSDFVEQHERYSDFFTDLLKGAEGKRPSSGLRTISGDGIDQKIADDKADKGTGKVREFIWWSDHFHFTTDAKGIVIQGKSPDKLENPIGMLPFTNIHGDQDNFFWAEGGDDIIDGSILINKDLTDLNYIAFVQGWGQLVVTARDVPKVLKGGPDNAFIFEQKENDPTPQVFFASSNPPIDAWLNKIKSYLGLLLSTNNLSPRNISASLDATNITSGIALMIEQSEVIDDVQDNQQNYQDWEPGYWEIVRRWHGLFHKKKLLIQDQQIITPFNDSNVKLKFFNLKPVVSESEQLENLEKRKNLGLNTMVDLIKIDNPDLSDEDAKAKAEEILNEKKEIQEKIIGDMMSKQKSNIPNDNEPPEDEEDKPNSDDIDNQV